MTEKVPNLRDLSLLLNVPEIESDARENWAKLEAKNRGLEKKIIRYVPGGLVTMAFVFFALSAPHTAELFNIITPEIGKAAFIGFELGILILAAFREAGHKTASTAALLGSLIGTLIGVNIIGGFMQIVLSGSAATGQDVQLQTMSLQTLLEQFGGLPAVYQLLVVLDIAAGIIIPFAGAFVGEMLVKLAMGRIVLSSDNPAQEWERAKPAVMYTALYNAALKLGAKSDTAAKWANSYVERGLREFDAPTPVTDGRGPALPDSLPPSPLPVPVAHADAAPFGFAANAVRPPAPPPQPTLPASPVRPSVRPSVVDAPRLGMHFPPNPNLVPPVEPQEDDAPVARARRNPNARAVARAWLQAHADEARRMDAAAIKTVYEKLGVGRTVFYDELAKLG